MNDGIDSELCKVSYMALGSALVWVRRYGWGALLAETNIESTFCLLSVHPDSFGDLKRIIVVGVPPLFCALCLGL